MSNNSIYEYTNMYIILWMCLTIMGGLAIDNHEVMNTVS